MVDVRLIGAWHTFKLTSKFINHQSSIGNHQSFDSTHVEVLFAFRMVCCLAGVLEKLKLLSLGQGFLIGKKTEEGKTEEGKTEEGKTEDRRQKTGTRSAMRSPVALLCLVLRRSGLLSCSAAVLRLASEAKRRQLIIFHQPAAWFESGRFQNPQNRRLHCFPSSKTSNHQLSRQVSPTQLPHPHSSPGHAPAPWC